jgi:hypothetical protein
MPGSEELVDYALQFNYGGQLLAVRQVHRTNASGAVSSLPRENNKRAALLVEQHVPVGQSFIG